ncbi:coiled-coil domain-containing protein 146-like [Sycon ciliatum]|uniref:coiled-coil domain-containing protein 146-like n=1 Tax=Sycon ciliatum TaxID=27933 RepID=UPI0031F69AA2
MSDQRGDSSPDMELVEDDSEEEASTSPVLESGSADEDDEGSPEKVDKQLPVDEAEMRSALQVLEERFADGSISGKQLACFKDSFTQLVDVLMRTRKSELDLMEKAKQLTHNLTSTEAQLSGVECLPAEDTSEAGQLRQLLLKHRNTLKMTEERIETLEENMEKEKLAVDDMRKEVERMPDPQEVRARRNTLTLETSSLKTELDKERESVATLREELTKNQKAIETSRASAEKALYSQVEVKDALMKARSEHTSIQRQIAALQKEQKDLERRSEAMRGEQKDVLAENSKWSAKLDKITRQQEHLQKLHKESGQHFVESQKEFERIAKALETAKEEEVILTGEKLTHDMNLKQIEESKQRIFEETARLGKEKETQLKALKLRHMQRNNGQDALKLLYTAKMKAVQQVQEATQELENRAQQYQRLQKEQKAAFDAATKEGLFSQEQKEEVRRLQQKEAAMKDLLEMIKKDVQQTNARHTQLEKDRDESIRSIETRNLRIMGMRNRLALLTSEVKDLEKYSRRAVKKHKDFRYLHDALKAERAKLAQLTALSQRKRGELLDKARLHVGIREVLQTEIENKNRLLQQSSLQYSSDVNARDVLKQDVSQARTKLRLAVMRCDEQTVQIGNTSRALTRAENEMRSVRDKYEDALQNRDDRGICIVAADEDLTVFLQKQNLHDKMTREANIAMNEREEEIRFLKVELAEEQRALAALKSTAPNRRELDDELVISQIKLAQLRDETARLEKTVQSADCERVVHLGGKDLEMSTLVERETELESMVSEREAQKQEKALMLMEVSRMSSTLQKRVTLTSEAALAEHNQLVQLRAKLEKTKLKMMATVAEIAVQEAELRAAQQDIAEKEAGLEEGINRLSQGLAPSAEAAEEWRRHCRYEEQLRKPQYTDTEYEEPAAAVRVLASGVHTTAPERKNAYVPAVTEQTQGSLVPIPYSSQGAFAEQPKGAQLRHYRKPVDKPLEI